MHAAESLSVPEPLMAEAETWKAVPGFEGHYEVSDLGRLASLKHGKRRILKTPPVKRGYLQCRLSKDGKGYQSRVHILVLLAFRGPRSTDHQTRHLDGNASNNRLDNLAWGTPKENAADTARHGTHPVWGTEREVMAKRACKAMARRVAEIRARLIESDVSEIRGLRRQGATLSELAARYDRSESYISRICSSQRCGGGLRRKRVVPRLHRTSPSPTLNRPTPLLRPGGGMHQSFDEFAVMPMTEAWVTIPNFEDYELSTDGRVRSARTSNPKIIGHCGGRVVSLPDAQGRFHRFDVARLLLTTFIGPRPRYTRISFLDGNKLNMRIDNLAWSDTPPKVEGCAMAPRPRRGMRSSLEPAEEAEMLSLRRRGWTVAHLATHFGISQSTAGDNLRRLTRIEELESQSTTAASA